jgi:deoxycytidylate deaminase
MKLEEIYKLRRDFSIIGLTGRTGSGCTKIANILSGNYNELKDGLRENLTTKDKIFNKKYNICKDYLSYDENWKQYDIIKYKNVLFFYLIGCYDLKSQEFKQLLLDYFNESQKDDNKKIVASVINEFDSLDTFSDLIEKIKSIPKPYKEVKDEKDLTLLNQIFFGKEFNTFSKSFFDILENNGYYSRTRFLHFISCNIRSSSDPLNDDSSEIIHIYTLANLINRIIKARKYSEKSAHVVIDSLRNSLEIMFFKERYSGFYMIATKNEKNDEKLRLSNRLKDVKSLKNNPLKIDEIAQKLIKLDATEYDSSDYQKGTFSSPDVSNCIQKSDIHILNENLPSKEYNGEDFFSCEEQLMKFISLIQQPGIITPSRSERCMQIAYNAKLNSGCISRQVGAVVTDKNYSINSIGWNDVPSGQTPCNLRSVNDLKDGDKNSGHYSEFERGENLDTVETEFKYKDKSPYTFPNAIQKYFHNTDTTVKNDDLNGKNCSFCFKTIHNFYEGEKNQVHTRSLHAEENAMMQISKKGGIGLFEGNLFTTASPCELCSKKASQLGIKKVYYIDPYPGISKQQILSNHETLKLIQFQGVIGKSYSKLYDPFMSYKDELTIMLENKPEKIKSSKLSEIKDEGLKSKLSEFYNGDVLDEEKLLKALK